MRVRPKEIYCQLVALEITVTIKYMIPHVRITRSYKALQKYTVIVFVACTDKRRVIVFF